MFIVNMPYHSNPPIVVAWSTVQKNCLGDSDPEFTETQDPHSAIAAIHLSLSAASASFAFANHNLSHIQ